MTANERFVLRKQWTAKTAWIGRKKKISYVGLKWLLFLPRNVSGQEAKQFYFTEKVHVVSIWLSDTNLVK